MGQSSETHLRRVVLKDGDVSVAILNYGAITQDWRVPCGGQRLPVILGYQDPARYLNDPVYMGAIVGRVANRTAHGRFTLAGSPIQVSCGYSRHHLHGGPAGLSTQYWDMDLDQSARKVELRYHSPDGQQGYPGNIWLNLNIHLSGTRVTYVMTARSDRLTPLNLAQHNYYNLLGSGPIWSHTLQTNTDRYLPLSADGIPTGQILKTRGSRNDFTTPTPFEDRDGDHTGHDINLVFAKERAPDDPVAVVRAPNGLCMRVWSDQPGAQLYTAPHLGQLTGGLDGRSYAPFGGFCLEPQGFPDALNHPNFPSILIDPDRPYRQVLSVEISEAAQ